MKKIEKFIINEELYRLLERVETRNFFSGLLWALELFILNVSSLPETISHIKMSELYDEYLDAFNSKVFDFESSKKKILDCGFLFILDTLDIPVLKEPTETPDKEDVLFISKILRKLYIKNIHFINYTDISDYILKIFNELIQYSKFEIINSLLTRIIEIIGCVKLHKIEVKDLHYYLKLSVFDANTEMQKKLNINIYLMGEDVYGLLESQKTNLRLNINIYHKNTILDKTSLCVLWQSNTYSITDNEKEQFDYIFSSNQIESLFSQLCGDFNCYDEFGKAYFTITKEMNEYNVSNADTVILGPSYVQTGINKECINSNVVKLGTQGQDIYTSYQFLKKLFYKNSAFKKCIFVVGYWTFFADYSYSNNPTLTRRIETYINTLTNDLHNYNEKFVPDFYDMLTWESRYFVLLTYCFDIVLMKDYVYENHFDHRKELLNFGKRDFSKESQSTKHDLYKNSSDRVKKMLRYKNTHEENLNIFNNIIELLKSHSTELFIVLTPLSKGYLEFLDTEVKANFDEVIASKLKEYTFIDMNKLDVSPFFKEDFSDPEHLNKSGVIKFTKYINEIIEGNF